MNSNSDQNIKKDSVVGFVWRFLQNSGVKFIQFAIQIVLARLLMPADYGLVAMISVFTSIAMVFIDTGFSSAIIQRKNINDEDLSSVFYCGIAISLVLYLLFWISSPYIASFYGEPRLVSLLRVQSISLVIAAFYSVQQALVTRCLQFKKSFVMSMFGMVTQGVVGIVLALKGYGAWALVFSTLGNNLVSCIVVTLLVRFKPMPIFSFRKIKALFSFSSKILFSNLINTLFNNVRSLIIGKVYSSEDLAYYNRGFNFPTAIMEVVDGSMTTVLFSTLSKCQDSWEEKGLNILRKAMKTSIFLCAPLMFGLCAVAEPLIMVLLTDKWIASVPYIRIVSIICLTWPLSAKMHALNARGKSNVTLILNIISKSLVLLGLFLTCRISIMALVTSSLIASCVSMIIELFVYKKYLGYSISTQITDVLPSFIIAGVMGCLIYLLTLSHLNYFLMLIMQVILGVVIYFVLSWLFNREVLGYFSSLIKDYFIKK